MKKPYRTPTITTTPRDQWMKEGVAVGDRFIRVSRTCSVATRNNMFAIRDGQQEVVLYPVEATQLSAVIDAINEEKETWDETDRVVLTIQGAAHVGALVK